MCFSAKQSWQHLGLVACRESHTQAVAVALVADLAAQGSKCRVLMPSLIALKAKIGNCGTGPDLLVESRCPDLGLLRPGSIPVYVSWLYFHVSARKLACKLQAAQKACMIRIGMEGELSPLASPTATNTKRRGIINLDFSPGHYFVTPGK